MFTAQWESGNSRVAFPFEDDSLPDGFPRGIIVDACVVVASGLSPSESRVTVGSVHVGPGMVSAFVLVGGRPALYCGVPRASFEPFSPVPMTPAMPGVSGMLSFGNVDFGSPATYRMDVPLSESAVVRPVVGRLERFLDPRTGRTASGVVGFEVPDGVSISFSEDGHDSVVSFSAGDSVRRLVPAPCSADDDVSRPHPVTSINGVRPDESGRIAVVFVHGDAGEVEK